MAIDQTYFVIDINLPDSEYSELDDFIARYGKEVLIALLGYQTYSEYIAAIATDTPEQKWLDLRDGKTYTVGTQQVHWNGLENDDKVSLISYYVYCKHLQHNQTLAGQVGKILPKSENSTVIDGLDKFTWSWNEFVQLYGYSGQWVYEPSARNFLDAHRSDFPNVITKDFSFTNSFGI